MTLASIPSPSTAVWHLGPLPIRAYALCIVAGIIVSAIITERRMRDRGAPQYAILDVAVWAVPFGIIGARIYNVITSWQVYFGKGGTGAISTLYIWQGGLGIWGAVAGGALGAWIACRNMRIPLTFVADCLAPALPVAQGLGRFGNWFNNELYGKATTLPWGLKVHQMDPSNPGHALIGPDGNPLLLPGLYQPTFLYEVVWDLGTALFVFLMDRKFKFGKGRAFALYVMAYTVGRAWIEYLRIDDANHILGLRLNDWTALVVFIGALVYFLRVKGSREILVPDGDEGGLRPVTEAEAIAIRAGESQTDSAGANTETDSAGPNSQTDSAGPNGTGPNGTGTNSAETNSAETDSAETDTAGSNGTETDSAETDSAGPGRTETDKTETGTGKATRTSKATATGKTATRKTATGKTGTKETSEKTATDPGTGDTKAAVKPGAGDAKTAVPPDVDLDLGDADRDTAGESHPATK